MTDEYMVWDIGDPEPEDVWGVLSDFVDDDYDNPILFGKTYDGEWKTYLNGGKMYLDWDDVVRRFGPVRGKRE